MARIAGIALIVCAAGCAAPSSAPVGPPPVDWGWPSAAAADGKSRLQLQTILRNGPWTPGGNETWQIQGQVETDDPDVLLSDLHATIRVTPDDGVERVLDRERSNVDAAHRNVAFFGLDLGPAARRIAALEIELKLVRVKTRRTKTATVSGPGETSRTIVTPFEFALTGEAAWVTVAAYSTDESIGAGAVRVPYGEMSHRWAASAAEIVDANGKPLQAMGGAGSGGFTSTMYGRMEDAQTPIAYPVTATFRVADSIDTEVVRYRFTDLDLAAVPPPR